MALTVAYWRERIRKINLSMARAVAARNTAGETKWLRLLTDATSTLANLLDPPTPEEEAELAEPIAAEPTPAPARFAIAMPAPAPINRISSWAYQLWYGTWLQSHWGDLIAAGSGPTPSALADTAKADGVLAFVTACNPFGPPDSALAGLGEYSLYTNVTFEGKACRVWIGGKLVAEGFAEDPVAFGIANGIEQ